MTSTDAAARQLGPLARTVVEFLRTMERLVSDANGAVAPGHWSPLEEFVAVEEFERLVPEGAFPDDGSGTASDGGPWASTVMGWPQYRECFQAWAASSPRYRNVLRRIAEFPGLVYLEVEEHHIHGDNETIFNSLSVYELNEEMKICRIRVEGADGWLTIPA